MPEFEAILFDYDGVLADSEPIHWECWAEVLRPMGVILDWEFYRDYCIGIDDRDMLRMMAGRSDPPRDWKSLWELYPRKKELFQARILTAMPFADGIERLLENLSAEYRLAVVSSSACSEIEPVLTHAGLRKYFATIVGGEDVKCHKPAPEPYLLAARRLGIQRALVVEDSAAGMESGRAAGFEVLAVKSPAEVPEVLVRRLSARAFAN